jgi:transcriptional regulator
MYVPSHFAEDRADVLQAAIRAHPLAALVVAASDGLVANHIPMLLSADGAMVRGHVARANPVWREAGSAAIAMFMGPQSYVSPNLYPSKHGDPRVVPTWNYVTVHVHGRLAVFEDRERLRELVTALTDVHEAPRDSQWRVTDAPAAYIDGLLGAIVGIEIPVERIEGKWKMSQNRAARDRDAVMDALRLG